MYFRAFYFCFQSYANIESSQKQQKKKNIQNKSIILVYRLRTRIKTPTFSVVHILVQLLDDLELEFVAALEAQQQQDYRERTLECSSGTSSTGHNGSAVPVDNWSPAPLGTASSAASSPKDLRKLEQKKRWKNWGWKYSPGGKTSSIEEEPPESPKQPSSKHSSPANSPKHKNPLAASPLRRQKSPSPSGGSTGLRSSAGARLCQLIDDSQDDSGDELQSLLINGRPASVHIVQMTSNGAGR